MRRFGATLTAVVLLVSACAGEEAEPGFPSLSPEDELALNLVAQVEVPDRAIVKFYEPEPGMLLVTEAGRNDGKPLIGTANLGLSAPALYERLSGEAAPPALVAAELRAEELRLTASRPWPTRIPNVESPPLLPTVSPRDVVLDWFASEFCSGGKAGGGWDWSVTWLNVSGSGWFTRGDTDWGRSTVSVFGGGGSVHFKVKYRTWSSWSTKADAIVNDGFYFDVLHSNFSFDFDFNASVDQADGDSYHWCGYGSR